MSEFPVSEPVSLVKPVSNHLDAAIQQALDQKTKPPGSLGVLESLAFQIARVQQTLSPELKQPHILVFAGDHGIVRHGVSAYPQDVSWQMVLNFLKGGAAINVLADTHGIKVKVIDVGVNHNFEMIPELVHAKVRKGTADMMRYPSMTLEECEQAMRVGQSQVANIAAQGANVVGFGEMGIGNTSAAALLMSRMLDLPLEECVGRGTGLTDKQLQYKLQLLQKVSLRHAEVTSPLAVLAALGGLEIAAIAGAMLEAASRNMLVLVDGFIATSACLVAVKLQPSLKEYAVFCHRSDEAGHRRMLKGLEVKPVLDLGMRLGEGTGCAAAYPLLESAINVLRNMASFADANVSECADNS